MLVASKITKKYNKRIISNFSFEFKVNKLYCIIGPSGSGKSTLLSILSGTNKEYEGAVYYKKINIRSLNNYTINNVGYVYQNYQLFDDLTALENIILPMDIRKIKIDYKELDYLLKYFNVNHIKNHKVKDLSGGEKQRIAIIRSLIKKPDILLLDEPTSALSSNYLEKLLSYLNKIKKDKIVIIVTHDKSLASCCDELIKINKSKSNIALKINKKIKEEKIKFNKTKKIQKKVFSINKFFSMVASYITSFALICICLCDVLSNFIKDVIDSSFKSLNNQGYVTVSAISNNEEMDFSKKLHKDYSHICYLGITSSLKQSLKQQIVFEGIYFNNYEIKKKEFIFDNYLSNFEDEFVLLVSVVGMYYIKDINYLNVTFLNENYKIKIDKVYPSNDDYCYIYCNNTNYLNFLFNKINIKKLETTYLYSNQANELYYYLIGDKKYSSYMFLLDKENNVILVNKNNIARICNAQIDYLINNYNINKYLISDFTNTYIDFDSGFYYIYVDNKLIQTIIDDDLKDNEIIVSEKLNIEDNLIIDGNTLIIKNISKDNNELIYINSDTFNLLSTSNNVFVMSLYTRQKINNFDNILINYSLFDISSFRVFDYMLYFIYIYGLIISILSLIAIYTIFNINLLNKKKEIKCLYNLGVYKSKISSLLIYDPLNIVISSILSAILSYFMCKIIVCLVYQSINNVTLEISFSLSFLLLLIVIPLVIIILPILIKINLVIKK